MLHVITRLSLSLFLTFLSATLFFRVALSQELPNQDCPRPEEGATVQEPPEISSRNGLLDLNLRFRSVLSNDGERRYCYVSDAGLLSPTLRFAAGDILSIHFKNDMPAESSTDGKTTMAMENISPASDAGCNGTMSAAATNLHFHGLTLPPICHQDEVIHTLVAPGQGFDYRAQIPRSNSPGLYWYHPHPHGFSEVQVQGGASGAMIIEGIGSLIPSLASLPERTFLLRDQLLPAALGKISDPLAPSWDVSINYVPIKYPRYIPARIEVKSNERQFWRVVNAAANTIFDLQVLYDGIPQSVEVFAIDGMPLNQGPIKETSILLPPGARAEFVVTTPASGQEARLVTQKFDSGPAGDSAPARPLANIVIVKSKDSKVAGKSKEKTKSHQNVVSPGQDVSLSNLKPVRTRNLYFSQNGNGTEGGAGAATKFFITAIGQSVKAFDMAAPPNIVVHLGTVEDWIVQNMTPEDHIFHIHQVHFQLIAVNEVPVNDPVIRDTIRVPHQVGRTPISSVRLRVDFRDPNIVGTFVYHCHILGHEDKGMMGSIQVLPEEKPPAVGANESMPKANPAIRTLDAASVPVTQH
jgi:FtsP/CotA-like multicopper oxidase with cupredoxin domain